jgi:CRISPR/Cas system-associated exonuclease Cas4 (RecB family)
MVTWPELYAYRECPLRHRYRYRTRVADLIGVGANSADTAERDVESAVKLPRGLGPSDYGKFVHRALEVLYGSDVQTADAVSAAADELPKTRISSAAASAASRLVDGVLASEVGPPGAGVCVEQPFQVRLDSLVLHGVFDRIERAGGGLRVIDYKVGVESPAHDFQAQAYAWALGRIDDEDADGLVCYLREDGAHVKRVTTPETVAAVGEVAHGLEHSLKAGDFPATPGPACAGCPYQIICPESDP